MCTYIYIYIYGYRSAHRPDATDWALGPPCAPTHRSVRCMHSYISYVPLLIYVVFYMGIYMSIYGCQDVYIGFYRHGLGAWAAVRTDASLGEMHA